MSASWQDIAREKRESRDKSLTAVFRLPEAPPSGIELPDGTKYPSTLLTEFELDVTESSAAVLVQDLASGKHKAVDVVHAFAHRATIAHGLTNCLTEVLFDEASERARQLDEHLARSGVPVGPLHGLPVSLKDQFRVEGAETSLGYVGWLGRKESKEEESLAVQALKEAGAIVFAKTNVPASLMVCDEQSAPFYPRIAADLFLGHGNQQQHLWVHMEPVQPSTFFLRLVRRGSSSSRHAWQRHRACFRLWYATLFISSI